jgi:hypothetical protein
MFNPQYPKTLLHGLVIGSTGSHSSSSSPTASTPMLQHYLEIDSSFLIAVFFSGGLPFALIQLGLELLSSSLFE